MHPPPAGLPFSLVISWDPEFDSMHTDRSRADAMTSRCQELRNLRVIERHTLRQYALNGLETSPDSTHREFLHETMIPPRCAEGSRVGVKFSRRVRCAHLPIPDRNPVFAEIVEIFTHLTPPHGDRPSDA